LRRRDAGPKKKRKMRQIPAFEDRVENVAHHCRFLSVVGVSNVGAGP
jgi:hypothetical protein